MRQRIPFRIDFYVRQRARLFMRSCSGAFVQSWIELWCADGRRNCSIFNSTDNFFVCAALTGL